MSRPRDCEQCWADGVHGIPATRHIDGRDLCQLCVLREGYQFTDGVAIAPLAMAAAAAAGPVMTIHAKDPKEFLANGGAELAKAAVKHFIKTQEETTMAEFIAVCRADGCDTGLTKANKSGYCAKHFYIGKKAPGKKGDRNPGRVCSNSDCGRKLRADNRSGICTPCSKGGKRAGGGQRKPMKNLQRKTATSAAKPSSSVKHSDQFAKMRKLPDSANGAATLMFTEPQLVRIFSTLPIDEKVICLQSYLDQVQG